MAIEKTRPNPDSRQIRSSCFFAEIAEINYTDSAKSLPISNLLEVLSVNLLSIKNIEFFNHKNVPADLSIKMAMFSISKGDMHPWIVPKYSSFCKFICCFPGNYSTVVAAEYLFFQKLKNLVNLVSLDIKPLP
ncbi:hypothetical protein AYI69_g2239 [Smittium culicis]|uniref:Uncharacterized protein n=1 Tax=Smittium culicis TaxID=133412 RepID=A0A1R1YN42_9FUNG|nr:hypothetical protein AYI69_g2239 [Smittium culicis]